MSGIHDEWTTDDGSIRLLLGDCLEILPTLADGSVDAVVTDPPYSVSKPGAVHRGNGKRNLDFFKCDSDWKSMTATVGEAVTQCIRIAKESASMYFWIGHRQMGTVVSNLEDAGYSTRFLVWSKKCPAPPPPNAGWPSGAELCVYAYRSGRTWNIKPSDMPRSNVFVADSYRHGQPGKVAHPTQKPMGVVVPLILASTNEGDTILDPFAGSGTAGVACIRLGRRFIGIEKEPRYFEIAKKRIRDELDKTRLIEKTPTLKQTTSLEPAEVSP